MYASTSTTECFIISELYKARQDKNSVVTRKTRHKTKEENTTRRHKKKTKERKIGPNKTRQGKAIHKKRKQSPGNHTQSSKRQSKGEHKTVTYLIKTQDNQLQDNSKTR